MFCDALLLLSDAQLINNADAASTNTVDLGNVTPKRKIGTGEPLCVAFAVDVAATTNDGDETYEFQVIQSENADLSSPEIIIKTDTGLITRSVLVAGYKFYLPIPPGFPTLRYLGAYYNIGGTTAVVTVTAFVAPLSMIQADAIYAKGFTIS